MEHVNASIRDNEKTLVKNVDTWIDFSESPSGIRSWNGGFTLSSEIHLEPGGPFTFETADGRSGQIIITNINYHSQKPTEIYFKGTGPFS